MLSGCSMAELPEGHAEPAHLGVDGPLRTPAHAEMSAFVCAEYKVEWRHRVSGYQTIDDRSIVPLYR